MTRGRFSCHTDATSSQIATYTTTAGGNTVTYSYEYDDNGNITSTVSTNSNTNSDTATSSTTTYEYDSANQLIRENNEAADYTHTWTYDNAGNILQRKEYDYTDGSLTNVTVDDSVSYGYPAVTDPENNTVWGDKLTSYGDKAITYDQIGNPLSFGNRTYSWEHGRQLNSLTEGNTTWNYTYNVGGMRTGRTDGTTTYSYIYSGSQLAQMKIGSNTLNFTYDAAGIPLTVTYNGTKYYYTTNIQGDVVAILDSSGTQVASYTYDAWGNCLTAPTSGVGLYNPLRYRGYVYDRETELYYLQSRYYDPELGRFLNADGYTTTGQGFVGNNMFIYGLNNPINLCDVSGFRAVINNRLQYEGQKGPTYYEDPRYHSDKNEKSDELLNHCKQVFNEMSEHEAFQLSVSYLGRQYKETDHSMAYADWVISLPVAGILNSVSPILSGILSIFSTMKTVSDINEKKRFPDGYYETYKITVSWQESYHWNGGTTYTYASYEFLLCWDTVSYLDPVWQVRSGRDNSKTKIEFN